MKEWGRQEIQKRGSCSSWKINYTWSHEQRIIPMWLGRLDLFEMHPLTHIDQWKEMSRYNPFGSQRRLIGCPQSCPTSSSRSWNKLALVLLYTQVFDIASQSNLEGPLQHKKNNLSLQHQDSGERWPVNLISTEIISIKYHQRKHGYMRVKVLLKSLP